MQADIDALLISKKARRAPFRRAALNEMASVFALN